MENFKREWFKNSQWWFSNSIEYDQYIIKHYEYLLDIDIEDNYQKDPITYIIICDQLPRHIYRNTYSNHIIQYFLEKALYIIKNTLLSTSCIYVNTLQPIEWIFFMLPLRHTKNAENIKYVLQQTWKKIETHNLLEYKRFLKATYRKFIVDIPIQLHSLNVNCQKQISKEHFEDILYFKGKCVNSLIEFNLNNKEVNYNFQPIDVSKPIIVSLSGGVDSMVCSWLLRHHFKSQNIIAVHINYNNRECCEKEEMFLKSWCASLNINLYIRKLDEINRQQCMKYEMRELYEEYTRQVRYATYKTINQKPQIILGHNKDDCLENIMTNICHKNKYDNLQGMEYASIQDDITFIRPLLSVYKDDIIKYAHSKGIPYLPNSTPVWSQRGQIRNKIIPCLDEWDKRFVHALYDLSHHIEELYSILEDKVQSFKNQGELRMNNDHILFTIKVSSLQEIPSEIIFWRLFLQRVYRIHDVSTKSLVNFQKVLKNCMSDRKIVLSKELIFDICVIKYGFKFTIIKKLY